MHLFSYLAADDPAPVFFCANGWSGDRHIYGGRFTAHWIIDDEETESFDFIFPGLNKYDIWRACIGTAKNAFRAEINMISIRRAWDMLSPEERTREQLIRGRSCG